MPSIGPLEIGIVVFVALLVFGPKRLPELGGSLGRTFRGFSKGIKGEEEIAEIAPPRSPAPTAQPEATTASAVPPGPSGSSSDALDTPQH